MTTELADLVAKDDAGSREFVRALNRERTRMVDLGPAFPFLAGLLLTALDAFLRARDVDAILVAMMLAQSFYRRRGETREYLKVPLQAHPVWADAAFWPDALDASRAA